MQKQKKTTAEILDQLKAGVEAIQTSDQWRDYLKMQASFHSYSMRNVILIQLQRPGATRVAGFRAWKKLGRYVKKGETGIRILAPMVVKKKDQDPGEVDKRVLIGFRGVSVFALEQTDGEPLPSEQLFRPLEGDEARARSVLEKLWSFADEKLGIPVGIEEIPGKANGYLQTSSPRCIVLREGNGMMLWAKSLAHELAHALLHLDEEDVHSRPHQEVEAESVAFVVMTRLGFDTSGYSFPYVAGWSEGDAEKVMESGDRIQRAARRILEAVLEEEDLEDGRLAA